MKRFSAQYIITNISDPLKRGIVTTEDDGTIISIEDTSGDLRETDSVEFHNGIIVPGFVNCHCHLELSHMKGAIEEKSGLGGFIQQIRTTRESATDHIQLTASSADDEMFRNGITLCADICNTSVTFPVKTNSKIKYINLLEVFGIDPDKAIRRISDIKKISDEAENAGMTFFLVPHSVYSMSVTLLRLLKERSLNNEVTSIHFAETEAEKIFLEKSSGPLMESYRNSGILPDKPEMAADHASAILNEITPSGNLILVHNTFADKELIDKIRTRKNLYWCLCPNSNIYIENRIPPVDLLRDENCEIVIGTDSLASNTALSILGELITLQENFPSLRIQELIRWGTINGAKALCEQDKYGKIEPGKKPGLVLIQNADLVNMKLLKDSFATRLI
jgi:cytosine/adenosine deaminase-related metal-dependent hydrolase